ncbi:hypothetical protein C5167_048873 [Papaver somniferum]|uniref:Uncharacterized protein n=1 Tax=Papaver somniferum TaxID=3469 RepID=A0A4Y7KJ67_PAPSO|nr:hypothetical protein C5167_048873 [Papaver somniferum]
MDFQSLDQDHDHFSSSSPPHDQEKEGSSPKPISTPNPTPISKYSPSPISTTPNNPNTPANNNITTTKSNTTGTTPNANDLSASTPEQIVVEDGGVIGGGVILTRNCSVSSTPSSQKFRAENQKQSKALQAAVVRAFSMRRSASVSEGYSRIHDQSDDPFGSPTNNNDDNKSMQGGGGGARSKNKNKKGWGGVPNPIW